MISAKNKSAIVEKEANVNNGVSDSLQKKTTKNGGLKLNVQFFL